HRRDPRRRLLDPSAERPHRREHPRPGRLDVEAREPHLLAGGCWLMRYLVISSDCHAGLPNEQYREWLDPEHRPAFDEFLAQRAAIETELAKAGLRNEDFAEEWERENAEGLRGGWDASRRDRELDADGVAGEVI